MKITAYKLNDNALQIVPAEVKRNWMDGTVDKYSYRCLPMTIANSYGWEIRSNSEFTAEYMGGETTDSIKITTIEGNNVPESHFGHGILTWHVGYLFKTEYPYGLYVRGPVNEMYANIVPLSGIVETHWLPFTFTMNWKFINPGGIHMKKDAIICHVFPIDLTVFDNMETEIVPIFENPELLNDHVAWMQSRKEFSKNMKHPLDWQKNYSRGTYPNKDVQVKEHKTKIKVPEFKNKND